MCVQYLLKFALCSLVHVVLEKNGKDHLNWSCEWKRSLELIMWMEKITWTDHVRNEDVLVKQQRNILHEIRKRKANWIGHILRRNCLLQRVIKVKIKGGIEVTGRRGRRRRKLLDDLKKRRGYSYLKEEALDRTMWKRLWTCPKTDY
jgi:hypothetical protein